MKSTKSVIEELFGICRDFVAIEKACVAGYIIAKKLSLTRCSYLNKYLESVDSSLVCRCAEILKRYGRSLSFETLIEFFELLVTCETRKKNGIAYTPLSVKKMMLMRVLKGGRMPTVFDPACGCGSFLLTAARVIHANTKLPYSEIVQQCIFGADIDAGALDKTRALFALLLIENGEDSEAVPELYELNMLKQQSLKVIKMRHANGFDCVVGNPPYVRFRNLDEVTQKDINRWKVSSCGNADLYMPFFEVGMSLVSKSGILTYITSNTYLQSVNGRCLRNWIADKQFSVEITDFRNAQIFANVTCYTCVTTIMSQGVAGISYRRAETPDCSDIPFTFYSFTSFDHDAPWRMRNAKVDKIIDKLENAGTSLSHFIIRNGLATLANSVFFFKHDREDKSYYYRTYDGKEWRIEKDICRNVIKPNVIHDEAELASKMEHAIFPYSVVSGKYIVLEESKFLKKYPEAYKFLCHCRPVLDGRDKGNGLYPTWYAYGRTQGMNCIGCKLLLPYIAGEPTAVLSTDRNLMFYCGYAIISDDVEELRYIKIFMESDAFWYFIYHTSKPYSKGFMSLAKNYLVRFSIPNLVGEERKALLSANTSEEKNRLVWKAFNISPSEVK